MNDVDGELSGINRRIERYLVIHDYAPLAWLSWMVFTAVAMVYTTVFGPLVGTVPWGEAAIVPTVMLGWGMVWILAGATVGWLPGRI